VTLNEVWVDGMAFPLDRMTLSKLDGILLVMDGRSLTVDG
jgi:hypothetical protein